MNPPDPPISTLQKKPSAARAWAGFKVLTLKGTNTGPEENSSKYLAFRGCYSTPGCGKAGERIGSTCSVDVERLKRRPPSKVGGSWHEFGI